MFELAIRATNERTARGTAPFRYAILLTKGDKASKKQISGTIRYVCIVCNVCIVCICACMYVYMYMYVMYVFMCVCVCVCLHVNMYMCTCTTCTTVCNSSKKQIRMCCMQNMCRLCYLPYAIHML